MIPFAGHAGVALITAFLFGIDPLLVLIGSIIPDLDTILFYFGIKWGNCHRKITHSLIFLMPFLVISIFVPFFIPLTVGIITHYVCDLDHWGLPLFYPFSKKRYSIMKLDERNKTKTPQECITNWVKKMDRKFYLELSLLIIGIILNWKYLINLVGAILGLY